MKKIVYFLILIIIFSLTFYYKESILISYNKYFLNENKSSELIKNEYYRNYNFKYVQNTDNFSPLSKQDILNIYYTIINSGMNEFTFYCSENYENCINDVKDIANNQTILSHINNFVHPFNGFKDLKTEIDSLGKVTVNINRNYDEEMKIIVNYKVDEIIKLYITNDMELTKKIRTIHDYIINNTKYDQDRSDKNIVKYKSDTAYGVLIDGYGLCGGYTDAMMLFLEKMGIKNYKISSNNHVWNTIYLNDKWYNLDLTWDDPITNDGKDYLEHTFFLINDEEMFKNDKTEHIYDKNVYTN